MPKPTPTRITPDAAFRAENGCESASSPAREISTEADQNLLLAQLPATELAAFVEQADKITCSLREVLFENGDVSTAVYFPVTAMISLVTELSGGTSIEAMTVGFEGVAGLELFHGVMTAHTKGVCQIAGELYRLPASNFLALVESSTALDHTLHRYSQFTQDAIAQSSACNSIHLLEQRCARWLLLTSDAVRNEQFSLTQEFLAQMLAVRRSGVTMAIGRLVRQKLICTRYGTITIIDREGLKKISCECYEVVRGRQRDFLN
ncbi:MAG: Crp/Fnr family transcriptional regulator [Gemmatimonadaceae bacterium]